MGGGNNGIKGGGKPQCHEHVLFISVLATQKPGTVWKLITQPVKPDVLQCGE